MTKTSVAIIGAGPAGIAAAVQLKRQGVDFILFEKNKPGGLLRNANLVENYLGFPAGISGKKLAALLEKHLQTLNIEISLQEVTEVNYNEELFRIRTSEDVYYADFLIIATGTKPRKDKSIHIHNTAIDRIFYEIADAPFEDMREAAIIGSGDAAFDYSLNLSRHNIKTTVYMRNEQCKALPLLFERAKNDKNITVLTNYHLIEINKNNLLSLSFYNKSRPVAVTTEYLFFAIGREPEHSFAAEELINPDNQLNYNDRIYFIGDVKNKDFRQASIASGDGILAAMIIAHKMKEKNESNK